MKKKRYLMMVLTCLLLVSGGAGRAENVRALDSDMWIFNSINSETIPNMTSPAYYSHQDAVGISEEIITRVASYNEKYRDDTNRPEIYVAISNPNELYYPGFGSNVGYTWFPNLTRLINTVIIKTGFHFGFKLQLTAQRF